jgi:predicted transcriptional regulator
MKLTIEVSQHTYDWLQKLADATGYHRSVEGMLAYVAAAIADGFRRPGSWERNVVSELFGSNVGGGK